MKKCNHIFLAFPTCGPNEFTCANLRCISEDTRCNGKDNCRDTFFTDEKDCREF